jgi:hypothetical protein
VANQGPVVGALSISPSNGTVTQGYNAIIVANNVTDLSGTVSSVQYYLESNGQAGLQTGVGGDTLAQTITPSTNGYVAYLNTSTLSLGAQTYYVNATDNNGATSAALTANFTVIPAATALTASATSGTTAHITWAGATPDTNEYILERSANGGAYTEITDPATTDTSYDDSGLTPGTTYTYRFKSLGNNGTSTYVTSLGMSTWKLGDANGDGKVDFSDFLIVQNSYNKPGGWLQGDFDGNGMVDFNDFMILQNALSAQQ